MSRNDRKMDTNKRVIGIDFGTTNCCVAIFRGQGAEIIPSDIGRNKIPSYVAFHFYDEEEEEEEEEEDAEVEIYCGETAKILEQENQKRTVYDVRRMFGRTFQDPRLQEDMQFWPFDVFDDKGQVKIKTGPDSSHTPVEIAAEIFKFLKKQASNYLNTEIYDVVVTVPAYFNSLQRKQTVDACTLADLNVLQLLNEPAAAAVAFNFNRKSSMASSNCLVFDFGGGTLDITILTISSGQFRIKAVGGDRHLGGQDIDNNLVYYCVEKFNELHGVDLLAEKDSPDRVVAEKVKKTMLRLKLECERQKQFLSTVNKVTIALSAVYEEKDLVVKITRKDFDLINLKLFEKCLNVLDEVLRNAKLDRKEIDEVMMAGGSSRIPRIQQMVSEYFGGKQLRFSVDVDEAVAIGAAMTAYFGYHFEIPNVCFQEPDSSAYEEDAPTKVAKASYSETMTNCTLALEYIHPLELQGHHKKAVNYSLALVSKLASLTNEKMQDIQRLLDSMFDEFNETNERKKSTYVPAIGIDLGTTFCCVAVFRNSKNAEIIQSEVGKNKTPSYIAFPGFGEDFGSEDEDTDEGESDIVCGQTAKDSAHDNQKGTIYDVKRMFGRHFQDHRLQQDMRFWPFKVIQCDKGQVKVKTGPNTTHTPVQITAELLKHLKAQADKYLNAEVSKAVVTVPAYFNRSQRKETIDACTLAGIDVLQLVNEPTAAAVAYNFHKKSSKNVPSNCLIFDFGGGTLDIAILTIIAGQVHVKAAGGDNHLGGQDIDNNLMEYCLEKFKEQHGIDLVADKNSKNKMLADKVIKRIRRLKAECEKQKQFLSTKGSDVTISLNAMHGQTDLVVKITAAIFDLRNMKLFEKCIEVLDAVLASAKMERKEIHEVVMAGGSSRIPRIQQMVSDYFGGKELSRSLDVDEAVAVGASIIAFYAEHVEIPNVVFYEEESKANVS